MTTVLNFGGTGTANIYVFRNVPPTTSNKYNTKMTLEFNQNGQSVVAPTFTIENSYIVRVQMTAVANPYPPAGVWKSFYAARNEVNYTFNFTTDYKKCQVTYTGSLNNATIIGTIENYNLLVTN